MDEEWSFLEDDYRIQQLGALRERLRRLEEVDYMTAVYKGYSNSGETLAEIQEEIAEVGQLIADLESSTQQE